MNFGVIKSYFLELRSILSNSRRLLAMVWGELGGLIVALISVYLLSSGVRFADTWVRAKLINILVSASSSHVFSSTLFLWVVLSGVMMLLPTVLASIRQYLFRIYWYFQERKFEMMVLSKKAELDVATHENKENQDLFNLINENGTWRIRNFLDRLMYMGDDVLGIVLSSSVILWSQPWMFLLVFLGTIPELIAEAKQGRKIWGINFARSEVKRRYWDLRNYFGTPTSLAELKIFQNNEKFLGMIGKLFEGFQNEEIAHERKSIIVKFGVSMISQGVLVIAFLYYVSLVVKGSMEVGTLTFVLASIVGFRNSLSSIFSSLGYQYQDNLFIKDIFRFLDLKSLVGESDEPVKLVKNKVPRIVFENVSFKYPDTKKYSIRHLNLTIEPGEKLAIVGVNGAGKSTLIKLLCRFYDPNEGRILIDGVDLKSISLSDWYDKVGVIFQTFSKYKFPVKEGIALGRSDMKLKMSDVEKSAADSGASSFIKKWEKGYEQMLGKGFSDSVEPSVGQWQKLALARTFYRGPEVLVLDEPTAAIDAEAEEKIFNRLEKNTRGKTVILISHRFSTVRRADKIVVIKGGRVFEEGSHEELLMMKGTYSKLFALQAKGYK